MAASRVVARLSSLYPKLGFSSVATSASPLKSAAKSNASASAKRIFSNSRLPAELGCLGSMMPLHSAIASARLKSILSSESQSWGLIPQGRTMLRDIDSFLLSGRGSLGRQYESYDPAATQCPYDVVCFKSRCWDAVRSIKGKNGTQILHPCNGLAYVS